MSASIRQSVFSFLSRLWPAGPIFTKELRVSSRRRRNFALRFVYLAILTLFIGLMWMEVVGRYDFDSGGSSAAYRASRMSDAGKAIVVCVVYFQFAAANVLGVILLSNAISDEVVHRTLGVLMCTPVTSFQIVLGKLLSKMLQLILLLAISLPLLAVVRVFGGVPWDYVVAGLCLTLAWALFSASVSLLLSVYSRRAYVVIFASGVIGGILYLLIPWMIVETYRHDMGSTLEKEIVPVLVHVNPIGGIVFLTETMMSPRGGAPFVFHWPISCAVALGASALVLTWATACVRKVALRQAGGGAAGPRSSMNRAGRRGSEGSVQPAGAVSLTWPDSSAGESLPGAALAERIADFSRIRRVRGSPIVWKELRRPAIRSHAWRILGFLAAATLLIFTYGLCSANNELNSESTHMAYGVVFTILGILWTTVLAATVITTEKEAQSWPILLATPLSDWHIVLGKAAGVLRRALPMWGLLMGHVLVFSIAGLIHPSAILHLCLLTLWAVVLLVGSGLYFSARFKKTTTAVIMNLGFIFLLWAVTPFVTYMVESQAAVYGRTPCSDWLASGNPVVQAAVVMETAADRRQNRYDYKAYASTGYFSAWGDLFEYRWPEGGLTYDATTWRIVMWTAWNCILGGLFAYLAKKRLRRKTM